MRAQCAWIQQHLSSEISTKVRTASSDGRTKRHSRCSRWLITDQEFLDILDSLKIKIVNMAREFLNGCRIPKNGGAFLGMEFPEVQ